MRKTEKDLQVSCMECIHRRRILTCHENQKFCETCKNACTCRKCSPDASGKELSYEQRKYFSPGMPISEYIQLKNKSKQSDKTETPSEESNIDIKKMQTTSPVVDVVEKESKPSKRKTVTKKTEKVLQSEQKDMSSNLTTEKNGQLSFLWD
mgnify:CR=1 FL=1